MNRTLRLTFTLLLTAVAAHAQSPGAGTTGPATPAESLYAATPARADSLVPAMIPPASVTTPARAFAGSHPPSRPHVITIRTESEIRAERDQMNALAGGAGGDLASAKRSLAETQRVLAAVNRDIDTLGRRIKVAKKAGNATARAAAEGERKQQESVRAYFEHLRTAHEAAIDDAQARAEYARAAVLACDWELQLVGRLGVEANDGDPAQFKLEQQYLDAMKWRGRAAERLASHEQVLADRRLRLYRAWADWLGGR